MFFSLANKVFLKFVLLLLLTIAALPYYSFAQGNLLITPKRVVFENGKRSEELNLANTGKDSATYIISLIQVRMNDDGEFIKVTQPDSTQQFADKNLRIFPRTVTLAPNEAQTVKVQVSKAGELKPGEYRSHLYFRAVPREAPLGDKISGNDSTISVHIVPIFGITMPVIVRIGACSSKVSLSDAGVVTQKDSMPMLKLTLNREGNMSVYGDMVVDHISDQGKVTRVGLVRGIAVYYPNAKRNFHLLLENNAGVNYHQGKLRLVYSDQAPKPAELAKSEITLN